MALEQDSPEVEINRKVTLDLSAQSEKSQDLHAEAEAEAEIAEHMAHESPEGRPGGAMIHGSSLGLMFILVFGSMIVVGIVIGLVWNWFAGAAAAALGIALMLFNPEVWANVLRSREHDQIKREEL